MKKILLAAIAFSAAIASQSAQAATQTASIAASADVSTVCTVTSAPLAFGEVNLTGVTDGQGTVTGTCTQGGAYNIGIDNGAHAVGGQRTLVSGANSLNYDIFSDAGHTTHWGNTVGTDTVALTGTGAAQAETVYGEIAAGQTKISSAGTPYSDTVQVTVTY